MPVRFRQSQTTHSAIFPPIWKHTLTAGTVCVHSNLLTSLLCFSTVSTVLLPTAVYTRSSCSCSFALHCSPYPFCLTFVKENSYVKLKINDEKGPPIFRPVKTRNRSTVAVYCLIQLQDGTATQQCDTTCNCASLQHISVSQLHKSLWEYCAKHPSLPNHKLTCSLYIKRYCTGICNNTHL